MSSDDKLWILLVLLVSMQGCGGCIDQLQRASLGERIAKMELLHSKQLEDVSARTITTKK